MYCQNFDPIFALMSSSPGSVNVLIGATLVVTTTNPEVMLPCSSSVLRSAHDPYAFILASAKMCIWILLDPLGIPCFTCCGTFHESSCTRSVVQQSHSLIKSEGSASSQLIPSIHTL